MKRIFTYGLMLAAFSFISGCVLISKTPLSEAAAKNDLSTVKDLLAKGANACEQGEYGLTPFMWAFSGENYYGSTTCANETFRILMENAFEKYKKDGQCSLLLWYAAAGGCNDLVNALLKKGYDVNEKYGTLNALGFAAQNGQIDTSKILLNNGADLDSAVYGLKEIASKQLPYLSSPNNRSLYDKANLGADILNRLKPKQVESKTDVASGLTKEYLENMVQTAVEGATKSQKKEPKTKSVPIETDIDKPSFALAERVFGDNDLAVIIGIEGYQSLPKSDYSVDDAKLVKDYLKALGLKERNIELIIDEKATKGSIEKTIEAWLKNKAKSDSRILVYYSGHGSPDPISGEPYLVPFDSDPNYLSITGYSLKRLYGNLEKLPASEVIVLLDACFSGAGGRSVLAKGARSLVRVEKVEINSDKLLVLSSAQGTQISTSSTETGHGIFTYYFLKALRERKKDIAAIYSYLRPLVEDEAKSINIEQTPALSREPTQIKGRFKLMN
ncbi:MAG: caspase family protein [Deltaproteobacteria bacterium]|nr:caspase family protein [Deltaproteobacteria bacterium]